MIGSVFFFVVPDSLSKMMGHIIFRHGTARDPAHLKEKKKEKKNWPGS
jgi:hypothetical protein